MYAVILAEGEGLRLKPLTDSTPKPLIPVSGTPLIQYTLELFERHGVKDIVICTSYKKEAIKECLGNGSRFGVRIQYSESDQLSGTGGALKKAAWMLDTTEKFFVSNSDEIRDIDLYAMRRFHEDCGATATVALTKASDVSQFGTVKMDGFKIKEFLEKPKSSEPLPGMINAGVYIMEPGSVDLIPNYGNPMLEKTVFPSLAKQGKLFGFQFAGRWMTINTLEQYEAAQRMIRGQGNFLTYIPIS